MKGKLSNKLSPRGIPVGLHPRDTNAGEMMLPLVLLHTGNVLGFRAGAEREA